MIFKLFILPLNPFTLTLLIFLYSTELSIKLSLFLFSKYVIKSFSPTLTLNPFSASSKDMITLLPFLMSVDGTTSREISSVASLELLTVMESSKKVSLTAELSLLSCRLIVQSVYT